MFYDRSDDLLFDEDITTVTLERVVDLLDLNQDETLALIGRSLVNQVGFEIPLQIQVDWEEFYQELREEVRKQTLHYIVGKLGIIRLVAELSAYSVTRRVAPITTRIAGRSLITGISAGAVGTRFIGPVRTPGRLKAARSVATAGRVAGRVFLVVGVIMTVADIMHLIRTGRFWGFQLFERAPIEIIMDGE